MRFSDLFKLSIRMFKARTMRTLLTILGMSIGIGAILFLVSLGYGLQKTLLERITTSESLLTLDVTEPKAEAVKINNDVLKKIEEIGVAEISPAAEITAQGQLEGLSSDIIAMAVQPSFFRLGGIKVSEGKLLNDDEPQGIVIASSVAKLFGKEVGEMFNQEMQFTFFFEKEEMEEDEEGAGLRSNFEKIDTGKSFKIIGVIESEDNLVFINSNALGDVQIDHYNQVKVKCNSSEDIPRVRDAILNLGFIVSALSDTVEQANQIFKIIQIILMLFGVVALVVSAIGMFNTMTVALLERTEEIGIMKAIGASNYAVSMMFIMESGIMGFLGGLAGVAIGVLGGKGFNTLINFVASRFGGEAVNLFYVPIWFVLLIVIFAALVGFFTGFVPARRASKIDPLEALRYK